MERQALKQAREAFLSGRTRPTEFRLQQLHSLKSMITDKQTEIANALKEDINRVSGGPTRPGPRRRTSPTTGVCVCVSPEPV